MRAVSFDVDIIPEPDAIRVAFTVPTSTDPRAVERLVTVLMSAFASAEHKTVEEMQAYLLDMMTMTPVNDGTRIELSRDCSDSSYFSRFDQALSGQTRLVH